LIVSLTSFSPDSTSLRIRSPIFDSAPDGVVAGFLIVDGLLGFFFVPELGVEPSELPVVDLPGSPDPPSAQAIPVPDVYAVPMPRATASAPTRPMYLVDSMTLRTSPLHSEPRPRRNVPRAVHGVGQTRRFAESGAALPSPAVT
jgi:hypothetical protein